MEKLKSLLTVPYKQENYKQFTADFLNDIRYLVNTKIA